MKYRITVIKLLGQNCLTKVQAGQLSATGCRYVEENPRHPGIVLILNRVDRQRVAAALKTDNFTLKVRRENDPKLPFKMSLKR